VLPRRAHLHVITKYAQLEFAHGSAERGRTYFEKVLATYPKKLDVWNVYIDAEVKLSAGQAANDRHFARAVRDGRHDPHARARALFERAIALRLSSKKIKSVFKKYLAYERARDAREGEAGSRVAHVKAQARAWIQASVERAGAREGGEGGERDVGDDDDDDE